MTTMKENMAAMKTEIISTVKLDLSNMVKEATKEAVDAAKDKLKGYIKRKLNKMVGNIETHISSLLNKLDAKLDTTPTAIAPTMPKTYNSQTQAQVISDGKSQDQKINYAHYPQAPYMQSQYSPNQMPQVADQFWHIIHQHYSSQESNSTITPSQQYNTNGQDRNWQEIKPQTVQMTEHSIQNTSANAGTR
eukprot:10457357-Ditylum_brightwellii.AAC.1